MFINLIKTKLTVITVALCIVSSAQAAQFLDLKESDYVWAKRYGKSYAALTQAVAVIGTKQKTLIVDGGGTWPVVTNLSIPTNVDLIVGSDTLITISSGKVLTVSGHIHSGNRQVFTGLGIVTGPCANAFVYADWVATNQNIEYLGTPYTNIVTIDNGYQYATTNWTTNLVTGTSNSIKTWATGEFYSASTVITITNMPVYMVQAARVSADIATVGSNKANTYMPITNLTAGVNTLFPNNFGIFNPTNGTWRPYRKGSYHMNLQGGYQVATNVYQLEFFLSEDYTTNPVATICTLPTLGDRKVGWNMTGDAYINIPTTAQTNSFYRPVFRYQHYGLSTGALNRPWVTGTYVTVRWYFLGDYTDIQ